MTETIRRRLLFFTLSLKERRIQQAIIVPYLLSELRRSATDLRHQCCSHDARTLVIPLPLFRDGRRCDEVGSLMSAIYSTFPIFRFVRFYLLIVLSHVVTREEKKKEKKVRVIYCIFSCFIPRAFENGCPITRQVVSFSLQLHSLPLVVSPSAL